MMLDLTDGFQALGPILQVLQNGNASEENGLVKARLGNRRTGKN